MATDSGATLRPPLAGVFARETCPYLREGPLSPDGIYIDVMVAEALAGPGTRGARLGAHGKRAARRAKGLEGALMDRERSVITALDRSDTRAVEIWIAGPGALFVSMVHKIPERINQRDRVRDKDALDVLRLLRAIDTDALAGRLAFLRDSSLAGSVTNEAIALLPKLLGDPSAEGVAMAVRAAGDPGGARDDCSLACRIGGSSYKRPSALGMRC